LDSLLKGRYEEERLLEENIGALPSHVRLVSADTPINPYVWFQLADFGITVRGTSGLEMAALGKTVITAGTGRYEGNGFTVDPATVEEYVSILESLPNVPEPTEEQIQLAQRYAHAIFLMKPFTIKSLLPRLKWGVKTMRASDDMVYDPIQFEGSQLPEELRKLGDWLLDASNADLLTGVEPSQRRPVEAIQ
jgi:hypothetical protein